MNTITTAQLNMEKYTHELNDDILQSIELAENNPIRLDVSKIQNIVICGMGGSGIGGMLANDILSDHIKLPITFCKSYVLPTYVSEHSLVVCSSYSGNTEETLALFEQAIAKKAQVISISSGGELIALSEKENVQSITIQGGKQPRAAIGLSLVQQIHILGHLFLSDADKSALFNNLKDICSELKTKADVYQKDAQQIANDIVGKKLNVFAETKFASLVTRFVQQINENAKQKIGEGIIPEMNHNQLVAYKDFDQNDVVILVNTSHYLPQNKKRVHFLKERLNKQGASIIEITKSGNTTAEVFVKTLYLMDLVSVELSKIKNIDPEEVEVIHNLKRFLRD
jgi:glucose/mannose-6-phosphate isomerase